MQLFPLNRQGLVHFLLNTLVNTLALYYLVYADILLIGNIVGLAKNRAKPLFSVLFRTFIGFGELSLLITSQLYSILFGPEVISVLNSPAFKNVQLFHSRAAAVKIVVCFFLLNTVVFLCDFNIQLGVWWMHLPLLKFVIVFCVLFIMATNTYVYLHLLLYLQFGTRVVLRGLQAELSGNSCVGRNRCDNSKSLTLVVFKLRQVALLNERALGLLAFPVSFFVFMNFCYYVCCWGLLFFFHTTFLGSLIFLFYPATGWMYFTLLVLLNTNNLKIFDQLKAQMDSAIIGRQQQQEKQLRGRKKRLTVEGRNFDQLNFPGDVASSFPSNQILLSNFELNNQYRRCFQVRFFSLIDVDLRFILATALLALNFIVFLAQTN